MLDRVPLVILKIITSYLDTLDIASLCLTSGYLRDVISQLDVWDTVDFKGEEVTKVYADETFSHCKDIKALHFNFDQRPLRNDLSPLKIEHTYIKTHLFFTFYAILYCGVSMCIFDLQKTCTSRETYRHRSAHQETSDCNS